jgi:hypothetical protein
MTAALTVTVYQCPSESESAFTHSTGNSRARASDRDSESEYRYHTCHRDLRLEGNCRSRPGRCHWQTVTRTSESESEVTVPATSYLSGRLRLGVIVTVGDRALTSACPQCHSLRHPSHCHGATSSYYIHTSTIL